MPSMEKGAEPSLLPQRFPEILILPFSLKPVMAEQNLQSWSPDISRLLPRLLASLIKALFLSVDTCLSNFWLMSSKQPDLDSITQLLKCT